MYRFTFWRCLHLLTQQGHRRDRWVTSPSLLGPGPSGMSGQRPSRGLSPEGSRVPPRRCIIGRTSPLFWHQWASGGFYTCAHTHTYIDTHTNTHIHRHTLRSSTEGPPWFHSLHLNLLFFPVMKPSLWGDDLSPTLWPAFPSSSFVELCISSWCRWGTQGPPSNPHGSVPEGAWPRSGMVALALLPSTRFPHCPESFLTGSVFSNTLYLFLSDTMRNRYCLLFLP